FYPVGLVAEQCPVGPHHRGRRSRAGAGTIHAREIAGVLGSAAQGRFLMEGVRRIGEARGPVAARLGFVDVRMEHDVRTAPGGPADRFGITPTLMADRDTKYQRPSLENVPFGAGRIDVLLLGGVDLNFVLEA